MRWRKNIELWATPPATGGAVIDRPRLALDRIAGAGARLIDLSAPQGYGRTLLLSEWHSSARAKQQPAIWVSMDGLRDEAQLIHVLACASQHSDVGLIDDTFADWLVETSDPIEALM